MTRIIFLCAALLSSPARAEKYCNGILTAIAAGDRSLQSL
jgi:hypothetical protein